MTTPELPIRTLAPADVEGVWHALETAFGGEPASDEERAVELGMVDPGRFYAAYDGEQPVATGGSFAFTMTVPGGPVPVAGVTWVGVRPTYRRRGLLSRLMQRQLEDLHAEGTAVAALWATEGAIYPRYGYGAAAWTLSVDVSRGAAFGRPVRTDRLRLVEPADPALRELYERCASDRSGWFRRDSDAWWRYRLYDGEGRRGGAGPLQAVVVDGPAGLDGYALYSVKGAWDAGLPSGTVMVREVVAASADAAAQLWRHLLDLDLTRATTAWSVASDDPLLHLLAEPRRAKAQVRDGLWVRLVDVPEALAARRYAADVDVVLEVSDPVCAWNVGRWRLTGGRDGAGCATTSDPADLVLGVDDLGAAYLGGTPLQTRAAAGRVEERTPGALSLASTAFGPLGRAPWCPLVF